MQIDCGWMQIDCGCVVREGGTRVDMHLNSGVRSGRSADGWQGAASNEKSARSNATRLRISERKKDGLSKPSVCFGRIKRMTGDVHAVTMQSLHFMRTNG